MIFTTLIDVESLNELRAAAARAERSADLAMLDCRFDLSRPAAGREAYLAGHIPGARFADLNQDLAAPVSGATGRHPLPAPDTLRDFFAAAGIGDGTQVVVYDAANGSLAARAWWLLRWLGKVEVAVLDGGFAAWIASGGALESGEPRLRPAQAPDRLTARPPADAVITTEAVLGSLQDPDRLLVDARAPERFAGLVEPLDSVAGHVPGAVNHPFTGNLTAEGRFLAAAELRRRWLERLGGTPPGRVVLMCGSGVTACHNLLAMEHAGLPGARLYAGSWSEWIRDPGRPVACG